MVGNPRITRMDTDAIESHRRFARRLTQIYRTIAPHNHEDTKKGAKAKLSHRLRAWDPRNLGVV